jgi:hypothetical protein
MRRYVFRLAMLSLAVLGPSVVRANDQEIAQQIVQKLQAEKQAGTLKGFSIDLSVEEGTVWLSGRVNNEDQQAKALDIARRVPGVKQVVNDLNIAPAATAAKPRSVFANMTNAVSKAMGRQTKQYEEVQTAGEEGAIGSGVANAVAPTAAPRPLVQMAQPVVSTPNYQPGYAQPSQPDYYSQAPQALPAPATRSQVPLAFAPARQVQYEGAVANSGGPVPMHLPGSGLGIAPARYDHPNMPGYAWPSYAAHPNYAAVTYPRQYSPTAWPYIGPFYPYPQVPLGWRKVTLEWDDGWWMLDFKDRRTMYNH